MSGLVGYGSSDEEDEIQPEKPAKVGKLDHLFGSRSYEYLLIVVLIPLDCKIRQSRASDGEGSQRYSQLRVKCDIRLN